MTHYKKRLLLTVALIPAIGIHAQTVYPDIVVKYSTKGDLVKYFPYSTVQVIDNRMDTTKIYTKQTGIYPPRHVNFNEPVATVIKEYIDSSLRNSEKGAGELLINIEQLSIANSHYTLRRYMSRKIRHKWLVRKSRRGEVVGNTMPRSYVQFEASAWYKNELGNYNRLLTINTVVGHSNFGFDKYVMRRLLNEYLKKIALINTDTLKKEKNIPYVQINVNVRNRWKEYPVIKNTNTEAGIADAFDDFRNNNIAAANIHLALNTKDSLYYITAGNDSLLRKKPHWGVYDGESWYLKLIDSSYLKLNRQGDTYGFYIPRNLPDMYAMLSMQENQIHSNSSSPSFAGANNTGLLVGLVAFLIFEGINDGVDKGINKKMEKRLTAEGLKHNYRYCTLNMDNGDILYNDK